MGDSDSRSQASALALLLPGDPEATKRVERETLGVPLEAETVQQLRELGEKIGADPPVEIGSH